jgi:hypothetical protein
LIPLRVDLAGGWLDVPKLSKKDAYVVNCAISPLVSLDNWNYEVGGGLGGSAAYAILQNKDGVESELANGVGWQDPAVIQETGLCVWRSGHYPELVLYGDHRMLDGKMQLYWTGRRHTTVDLVDLPRNYDLIIEASHLAFIGCFANNYESILEAVQLTYEVQLEEGMAPLPDFGEKAKKYCGSGFGGYALYLDCPKELMAVEPFVKGVT